MKKTLLVVVIVAVLAVAGGVALVRPEWLAEAWLWIVGFFGVLYGLGRRLLDALTGESELREIEAGNARLREDLERLRAEAQAARRSLEAEKARFRREAGTLRERLAEQRGEVNAARAELERLRSMRYDEYFASLPEEEQRRLTESMWNRVVFAP